MENRLSILAKHKQPRHISPHIWGIVSKMKSQGAIWSPREGNPASIEHWDKIREKQTYIRLTQHYVVLLYKMHFGLVDLQWKIARGRAILEDNWKAGEASLAEARERWSKEDVQT